MAPAFSSTRQAAAFALLLLVTLLAPVIFGKWALPSREAMYASIGWRHGSFPYAAEQIFAEKGDIDIAFVGSSHIYYDIDTPFVQAQLSQTLGRPAVVRTIGWENQGTDAFYFTARDLLQHRKVHLLVFFDQYLQTMPPALPHVTLWQWERFGDDGSDLSGLPLAMQTWYYYGSILGMPRNLLNCFRSNITTPAPELFKLEFPDAIFPFERLGAFTSLLGYINNPHLFQPYTPQSTATPADVCFYSPETREKFSFPQEPAASLQTYFAQKFRTVAARYSTHLVCLNLPILADEHHADLQEGHIWNENFNPGADLIGIPPVKLFAGMEESDVRKLYKDPVHMNQNGQAYFTRLITPALIQLYQQARP